jgi:hypothetical protein
MIVPTRGQDWFDNGRWLEIHRQLWSPSSPSGLDDINRVWLTGFVGVSRANVMLEALQNVTVANQAVIEAELRTLRAFFYYMLMDMFGGVPIVTRTEIMPRPRNTRLEVFQFIESELNAARAVLPDRWDTAPPFDPVASLGRMTKGATDAILANMYLNAAVFTKDVGINATAYNSCISVQVGATTACDAAIAAADRILNSGVYTLASDWGANFRHDNHLSPENILVVKHINRAGLGFRFLQATLHYNQFTPGPWNGFATLAEAYNAFDPNDQRRQIFLVGEQRHLETGALVNDRAGAQLVFTPEIANATQASEGEGVRIAKWPPDPNHAGEDNGNDFPLFRLGEIYLIKAEALNELTPGDGAALQLLNDLRARVFEPDQPLAAVTRDAILSERLFELTAEIRRRQDLIRHGKYTQRWSLTMIGGKEQREPHRVLLPIPQSQLDANPLLTQNAGY